MATYITKSGARATGMFEVIRLPRKRKKRRKKSWGPFWTEFVEIRFKGQTCTNCDRIITTHDFTSGSYMKTEGGYMHWNCDDQ